jgi:predicted RNase H-like nuclease (RuvC/YqgF family)
MFGLPSLAAGALGVLGKIPVWAWFLSAALIWGWLGNHKAASLQKDWAKEREDIAALTRRDEALHRAEERRREIEKEGVVNALSKKLDQARASSANESSRVAQLQRDVADLRAGRAVSGNPTPVSPGEAADRLGTVAGECVGRFGQVVALARKALIASNGCTSQYDTLTPSVKR